MAGTVLPVAAQSSTSSPKGSGLSISPTLSQFTIKPGESQKLDLKLKNVTVSDINAQAFVNDFIADNDTGNPQIITDPNKTTPNSIKKFVVGLEDIPLKVGEQKTANLSIEIPKGTTAGAYYGVIRYKAVPAGNNTPKEGEVALSASVGSIVLVTVPGNIKEQVQLNGIHVYNGKHEGTFFFKKPNKIGVEIKNLGNGFVAPFGSVEVQKSGIGSSTTKYQLNNVNPRGVILPGSERTFTNDLKNINQIGRYKVIASVAYGSGSQVLTSEKTFWYIPGWLLITILIIVAILVIAVLMAYRKHKWFAKKRSHKRGS
jgi:hypothetical protein